MTLSGSVLNYCIFFCYKLPKSQINGPRQIQNSLAHAVVALSQSSLHRLKANERIKYKLLSSLHKAGHLNCIVQHSLAISRPNCCRTICVFLIAKYFNRCFVSPCLWNQFPVRSISLTLILFWSISSVAPFITVHTVTFFILPQILSQTDHWH